MATTLSYILVILLMGLGTLAAIVLISIFRPNDDNGTIIGQIIGFSSVITLALIGIIKQQEIHVSVNSLWDRERSDRIRESDNRATAAKAEGVLEGRSQQAGTPEVVPVKEKQ